MKRQNLRWVLGLVYILAVAAIWIAASFVVQSVVDVGVLPFIITYICNSLFLVHIPLVEIGRYLEDKYGSILFWRKGVDAGLEKMRDSEEVIILEKVGESAHDGHSADELSNGNSSEGESVLGQQVGDREMDGELDEKGRWTRMRVAKVNCGICFENYPLDHINTVACGHPFCRICWKAYISTSINDGPGCLMLRCPDPSCSIAVGQDMIELLTSIEDKKKYHHYILRSFIENNRKTKWCPAPGCDSAVEYVVGSGNYDVTCSCSYGFCWNCTEEAHRPVRPIQRTNSVQVRLLLLR